jgi:hypothetical protein
MEEPFIGLKRWWRGEDAVAGAGEINSDGFDVETGKEEAWRWRFDGRNEGDSIVLRFLSH